MIPYEELHKHFIKPKQWTPNDQSYFDHYQKIPRKLKKQATKSIAVKMPLLNKLWYFQGLKNPDHNRFLIKCILDLYN